MTLSEAEKSSRKRCNRSKLIFIASAVATVIAIVILIFVLIHNATKDRSNIYETDAVFIPTDENGDTKYALYKKDGTKLTDFVFKQHGVFIDGYAYVENSDGKKGVIEHNGKMSIEFGEYSSIMPRIGIYEVNKDGVEKLVKGNGDVIAEDYKSYDYSAVAPYVVVKLGDNKYELYNAFGDKLSDFESSETPKISDDNAKTASAVSYDGGLIILNNRTFRVTKTVETNTRYDINAASEKGEIIVFSEKDKHYDKDAKRAIFNKEFVEFGDKCQKIKINNNFKNKERLYLTCDIDNKEHLIRNNEVTDVITSTYGGGYIVYDENHYVNYDSDKKKATFYVNGEEKASVDADYRLVISTKGYTINDYAKKYVAIYNLEGKQVYKISDAAAASELTGIDANENVIVRDGKQDTDKRYVLVNKEGKEISSRYTSMTEHGKYYSAFNRADNKGDLLDKDGQVIISGDYNEFVFYDEQEIILGRKGNYSDRSFDLINVKDKNVKVTFSGNVSLVDSGYFSFEKDGEVKIYTLEGKEIHSYKK